MRWQLVAQVARAGAAGLGHLLAQVGDFLHEPVNLLLLAVEGHVQLIQQILGVAGLDLQLGQAIIGGVGGGWGGGGAPPGGGAMLGK